MTETTASLHPRHAAPLLVRGGFLDSLFGAARRTLGAAFAWRRDADEVRRIRREAAAVRELARRYGASDRGFAADLYAAADRHEDLMSAGRAHPLT